MRIAQFLNGDQFSSCCLAVFAVEILVVLVVCVFQSHPQPSHIIVLSELFLIFDGSAHFVTNGVPIPNYRHRLRVVPTQLDSNWLYILLHQRERPYAAPTRIVLERIYWRTNLAQNHDVFSEKMACRRPALLRCLAETTGRCQGFLHTIHT